MIEEGVIAPKQRFGIWPVVSLCVTVLLLVCIIELFHSLGQISKEQSNSSIRGYKNRAVICDMIKGLGIQEPEACAEAVIAPYRDPSVKFASTAGARNSKQTYDILCYVLQQTAKQPKSTLVVPPGWCTGG